MRAGTASSSKALEEDKLITVSSVVTPAQFARGQDEGCRSAVNAAVTLKSVVLTLALYEGEDGVLLLGWRQSLSGQQSSVKIDNSHKNILQVEWVKDKTNIPKLNAYLLLSIHLFTIFKRVCRATIMFITAYFSTLSTRMTPREPNSPFMKPLLNSLAADELFSAKSTKMMKILPRNVNVKQNQILLHLTPDPIPHWYEFNWFSLEPYPILPPSCMLTKKCRRKHL